MTRRQHNACRDVCGHLKIALSGQARQVHNKPVIRLHAIDKATGEEIARIDIPATTNTAPMSFMHEGRQYILLSIASAPDNPAELIALILPD